MGISVNRTADNESQVSKGTPQAGEAGGASQWPKLRVIGLLCLSACAMFFPKLAVASGFLALVVGLSLPRLIGPPKRWAWSLLWLSVVCSGFGFFRFVLEEAIPGVIAGGQAAVSKHTVAFMRTIVTAQDKVRAGAMLDHDRDGIGSAARLSELSGLQPLRNGSRFEVAPLLLKPQQLIEAPLVEVDEVAMNAEVPAAGGDGHATTSAPPRQELVEKGAYLFKLCLPVLAPTNPGTSDHRPVFSAKSGAAVDEERAERNYLLYAWPKADGQGSPTTVYFTDQHEALAVFEDTSKLFRGLTSTPPCDARHRGPAAQRFVPWKDKTPRTQLPGDR